MLVRQLHCCLQECVVLCTLFLMLSCKIKLSIIKTTLIQSQEVSLGLSLGSRNVYWQMVPSSGMFCIPLFDLQISEFNPHCWATWFYPQNIAEWWWVNYSNTNANERSMKLRNVLGDGETIILLGSTVLLGRAVLLCPAVLLCHAVLLGRAVLLGHPVSYSLQSPKPVWCGTLRYNKINIT